MEVKQKSRVLGELRWDLDGAKMPFLGPWSGPGWRQDVTRMTMWHEYRDLDGDEACTGWRWDTNLGTWREWDGTWMQMSCNPGELTGRETWQRWRWDANLGTWMQMRWNLDAGEMQILRYGWEWDGALMEVRHKPWGLDGMRWDLDETEMHFAECRWGWDVNWMNIETWLEMRHDYQVLAGSEMGPGWNWYAIVLIWMGVGMWPRWRWGVNIGTWMEVRQGLDGGETHLETCILVGWDLDGNAILGTQMVAIQHGWRWDENIGTLILFSRDLYKGEMQHAGRWDATLATWMQVGQDLDGGEIYFLRPGCGRDAKSWDMESCEALTGWCWDANLRIWIVIRTKSHGLSGGVMWPGWGNAHRGT